MLKDIFIKKENQIMLGVIVVSVVLICFGFYFLFKNGDQNLEPRQIPNTEKEIIWKKFESKKYNFSLEYPEHFLTFEDEKAIGPVFNFYFNLKGSELPLTHLVEESHFSVYPTGVPSGSDPSLVTKESDYKNKNGVSFKIKDYKTYSGRTWAIMAIPSQTPQNWKSWGFIWISSRISDPSFKCLDGNISISIESCNPLEGDQFYKEGNVDEDFIKIGREFLDRISFS